MKARKYINFYTVFYIILIVTSAVFLILERITHIEFLLHLAAIPLEVLVAVFIVHRYLDNRENKEKRSQLMYIKSLLFRLEMRNLFITNFNALESPSITMSKIKNSSLEQLKQMRADAVDVKYKSPEAMESVIAEYVKAEDVWNNFMDRAVIYSFDEIFQDMVYILHLVCDVKIFNETHSDRMFIHEALNNESLRNKVNTVLGDGIRKFLDYAIELKEKNASMFHDIISEYEVSSSIHG